MLWRTHVLAGVASLWFVQAIPGSLATINVGAIATIAALGALLPDLDAVESKIKNLHVGGIRPFAPLATLIHRSFGHRGLLHSVAGLLIVSMMATPFSFWFGWQVPLALCLGYASHLLMDACTRSGIPLWPTRATRLHLLPRRLRFVTGSAAEDAIFPLLGVVVVLLLLFHLPFTSHF